MTARSYLYAPGDEHAKLIRAANGACASRIRRACVEPPAQFPVGNAASTDVAANFRWCWNS